MNRVKIVATIGPRTDNAETLLALRGAGMDVARLNGSHSDLQWHQQTIEMIRRTVPDVPVLLDLPGSKIRTTNVTQEISVAAGQQVVLTTDNGDPSLAKVSVNYPELPQRVAVGDNIVMDDGSLTLVVKGIVGQEVVCRATHPGTIRNGQGVHLQGPNSRPEFLSAKDRELITFAIQQEVDFIGLSFVETASDVHSVRDLIQGTSPQLVCKIETQKSLEHLQDLLEISDAMMIDRGDLSVETKPETVGLLQKMILKGSQPVRPPGHRGHGDLAIHGQQSSGHQGGDQRHHQSGAGRRRSSDAFQRNRRGGFPDGGGGSDASGGGRSLRKPAGPRVLLSKQDGIRKQCTPRRERSHRPDVPPPGDHQDCRHHHFRVRRQKRGQQEPVPAYPGREQRCRGSPPVQTCSGASKVST